MSGQYVITDHQPPDFLNERPKCTITSDNPQVEEPQGNYEQSFPNPAQRYGVTVSTILTGDIA